MSPLLYRGPYVCAELRTPAQRAEIERRVALYEQRAAQGRDLFTGEFVNARPVVERPPTRPVIARGIVHAACGTDGWRHYGRKGWGAARGRWKCVVCGLKNSADRRRRTLAELRVVG